MLSGSVNDQRPLASAVVCSSNHIGMSCVIVASGCAIPLITTELSRVVDSFAGWMIASPRTGEPVGTGAADDGAVVTGGGGRVGAGVGVGLGEGVGVGDGVGGSVGVGVGVGGGVAVGRGVGL